MTQMTTQGDLPISKFKEEILTAVRESAVTIITAETGAGKSTQVPQFLLAEGYDLVVTQPRRLAARTVATRVAEEMGLDFGDTIGWKVGGGQGEFSPATQCLFCTDGLALVRELMGQNKGVLVLDEVHEWNENMEVLVAWAKQSIEAGVDMKVVLMSATLEAEKLSAYFDGAPVISVPGRTFPVEDQTAGTRLDIDVADLLRQGRNVLVFQPGKQEIADLVSRLQRTEGLNAEILPLHGQLTPEEQARCFRSYGRAKCVVSTNVAQTSVTISDIDAVVDSGMERRIELVDGVEGLYLKSISRADATQRKGRAGRTKPGVYIDHCGESTRPDFPVAEILRKRLDQTVLRLAIAGFDMAEMDFFHQPAKSDIVDSRRSLIGLGCMTADGEVTQIGKLVNRLPVSVQYGRMLVEADRLKVMDDVLTIAAIMEMGGITVPPPSRNRPNRPDWRQMVPDEKESDVMGQLAVWQMAESMTKDEMRKRGISIRDYFRAKDIRKHLAKSLEKYFRFGSNGKRENILKAVCAGMVDHLYQGEYGHYKNGDNIERELGTASLVRGAEWLVGKPFDLQIQTRRGSMTLRLIELATKVDPTWLTEVAPHLSEAKTGLRPTYSPEKDIVTSVTETFFNGRKVGEETVDDEEHLEASKVFARWLSSQSGLPTMPDYSAGQALESMLRSNAERQERARQLNIRTGEQTFPVFSSDEMFEQFVTALSGARRILEIVRPETLGLPTLDEDKVASVLRDNPDMINVLGNNLVVEYRTPSYGTVYSPRVKLTEEMMKANDWIQLPDEGVILPGGRSVEMVVSFGYHTTIADTNIPQLKTKVHEHLNHEQWEKWTNRPEIKVPNPKVEDSTVPFEVTVYGQCTLTGDELKTYGTIAVNTGHWYASDPWFRTVWYRDITEATNSSDASTKKLTELKLEAKAEMEREEIKAETGIIYEELQNLRSKPFWFNLDEELRCRVHDSSIPSNTDGIQVWTMEIRALVAEVKEALTKIQHQREETETYLESAGIPQWLSELFSETPTDLRHFVENVDSLDPHRLDEHEVCGCGRARASANILSAWNSSTNYNLSEYGKEWVFFRGADPNDVKVWIWERVMENQRRPTPTMVETTPTTPTEEQTPADLSKVDLSKLFGGGARVK